MSHTDWILIITIISFSSTIGVYLVIKKIHQCTPIAQNVLSRRSGDIELPTFNEPTRPLETYFPRELDELTSITPSYFSNNEVINGYVPHYQTVILERVGPQSNTGEITYINSTLGSDINSNSLNFQPIPDPIYINSILENENTYFIILLILFIIILFIIIYMFLIKQEKH